MVNSKVEVEGVGELEYPTRSERQCLEESPSSFLQLFQAHGQETMSLLKGTALSQFSNRLAASLGNWATSRPRRGRCASIDCFVGSLEINSIRGILVALRSSTFR